MHRCMGITKYQDAAKLILGRQACCIRYILGLRRKPPYRSKTTDFWYHALLVHDNIYHLSSITLQTSRITPYDTIYTILPKCKWNFPDPRTNVHQPTHLYVRTQLRSTPQPQTQLQDHTQHNRPAQQHECHNRHGQGSRTVSTAIRPEKICVVARR